MSIVEEDVYKELAKLLESLTTTRSNSDADTMKKLKNICRKSDDYINRAYHILKHQLEKDHSEIRLYTVGVIDELFMRSHAFRELLLAEFQDFMELTLETDLDDPLPPPKTAAKNLKLKATLCVQRWNEKFGDKYKQLQLGYKFLKNCKNIDFNDIEARSQAERTREELIELQRRSIAQENIRKALSVMTEKQCVIENCITEFNNAFRLLMNTNDNIFSVEDFENPQPSCSKSSNIIESAENSQENGGVCKEAMETGDENDVSDSEDKYSDGESENLVREHGLGSHTYNLEINIGENKGIPVNNNNAIIVVNLKELIKELNNTHLREVSKWVQVFGKSDSHSDQLKKAIDLKRAIQEVLEKYKELKIPDSLSALIDSDSDDDFEEVPEKEDYEEDVKITPVKTNLPSHLFNFSQSHKKEDEIDPTTLAANEKAITDKISSLHSNVVPSTSSNNQNGSVDSKKAELLSKAPKLRYDVDLFRWNEKLEAPTMIKYEGLHRWWQPPENETVEIKKSDQSSMLRMRRIEFTGDYEPVKWQCRAPLPSGKLCPRRDRIKCPFHGKIIPRNDQGEPTNPDDIERIKKEEEEKEKSKPPEWQDPELLRELKAATGLDLTVGKKSRKGKKKKYPDLTDMKEIRNTVRRRLETKVLSKTAVKRVASTLDLADYKKHRDKFGDQFNYQF